MLNSITLIGNLGNDPELRYTPSGNPVTDFRLAVNQRWNNSAGEPQEHVEWFTVTCWNRLAENVSQYLTKGQRCYVQGRFQSRQFVGNDGRNRTVLEVIANTVLFLDAPAEERQPATGEDGPPFDEESDEESEPDGEESEQGELSAGAAKQAAAKATATKQAPRKSAATRR